MKSGAKRRAGRIIFVTGTDTGVGKTMLTLLLARYLREKSIRVAALKPICSGGRDDATLLHKALGGALTLDEINPWHFRAAQAPLLAARAEGERVDLAEVVAHVRRIRARFDCVLIEGAGGLLSPLGEGFNTRRLITSLRATPIVVCPNRLGAITQTLTVLAALPRHAAKHAQLVLVSPETPDANTRTNAGLLSEFVERRRVHVLPWLRHARLLPETRLTSKLRDVASAVLGE